MSSLDHSVHRAMRGAYAQAHQLASSLEDAKSETDALNSAVDQLLRGTIRTRKSERNADRAQMYRLFVLLRKEVDELGRGTSPAVALRGLSASELESLALRASRAFVRSSNNLSAAARTFVDQLDGVEMPQTTDRDALAEASRAAAFAVLNARLFFRVLRESVVGFDKLLLTHIVTLAQGGRPWPTALNSHTFGSPCLHHAAAEQLNAPLVAELLRIPNDNADQQLGCGCSRIAVLSQLARSWAEARMMRDPIDPSDSRAVVNLIAKSAAGLSPIMRERMQRELLFLLVTHNRHRDDSVVEDIYAAFLAHSPKCEHQRIRASAITLSFALECAEPFLAAHEADFINSPLRCTMFDVAEPARFDSDTLLMVGFAFRRHSKEDLTGWLLERGAGLYDLAPMTYRMDISRRVYADTLGHAAIMKDEQVVRTLAPLFDAETYTSWEQRMRWPARLAHLESALSACQPADKNVVGLLAEQTLAALHALSAVVLADARLSEDAQVREAIAIFVELTALISEEWHFRQAEQRKQLERVAGAEPHTSALTLYAREADGGSSVALGKMRSRSSRERIRPSKAQLRAGAQKLVTLWPLLAPLCDSDRRKELYLQAQSVPPNASALADLAQALREMRLPRLAQVYICGGVAPALLLLREGPRPAPREHAMLVALLLVQGAHNDRPRRSLRAACDASTHRERAALLRELTRPAIVGDRPEMVALCAAAALSCDATAWLEAWAVELEAAGIPLWGAGADAQRAAFDRALNASDETLAWMLTRCDAEMLAQALGEGAEEGETVLHRLARRPQVGLERILARLPARALDVALGRQSAGGLTPALEALACGNTHLFELLMTRAQPGKDAWQSLSSADVSLMLAQSSKEGLAILTRKLSEDAQLLAKARPHLGALAVQLAEGACAKPLERLARTYPQVLLEVTPRQPTVFHALARLGLRSLFVQLRALLGVRALRTALEHRDAEGACAHELAADESFAAELLPATKRVVDARPRVLRSGLEPALYAVATAGHAEKCEEALEQMLATAAPLMDKPDAKLRALIDAQCWSALGVAARWRKPGMGVHFAAHRPGVPLATLRARAERRELCGSSRFGSKDGFWLLRGRSQALEAARGALDDASLLLAPLVFAAPLSDDSDSEGFVRLSDSSLVHEQHFSTAQFVLSSRHGQVFIVTAYPSR